MADQVHYHLEGMLPELQDLEHRGIFSKHEIKVIVKRRTALEYAIHRRIPKRSDFLQYIDFEANLEKLRRKRKQRLGLDRAPRIDPATGESTERAITLSDYSILRRIHTLYQKMLKKFKGDTQLWVRYFDWCQQSGSTKALGRSFATAIQLHPTKPMFWILAAAWEIEHNNHVDAARVLLQRGLRINPVDRKMWIEYFKMEMMWVEKIKARRRVLFNEDLNALAGNVDADGVVDADADAVGDVAEAVDANGDTATKTKLKKVNFKPDGFEDDDEEDDDNDDDNMDQDDTENGPHNGVHVPSLSIEQDLASNSLARDTAAAATAAAAGKESLTPMQKALIDIVIPRAIYRNAIRAIPDDLAFRMSFIEVYSHFGKAALAGINDVYTSIEADFSTDPEALAKLAERHLAFVGPLDPELPAAIKRAISDFESYLAKEPSSELWMKFVAFISSQRSATEEPNLVRYLDILHDRACAAAHDSGHATIPMYLAWASNAAAYGELSDAIAVLDRALSAIPTSSVLWIEKAARLNKPQEKIDTLQQATCAVTPKEQCNVWKTYCQTLIDTNASTKIIDSAFKTALSPLHLGATPADHAVILTQYINWANTQHATDIASFRQFVSNLKRSSIPQPFAFYHTCITIEMDHLRRQQEHGNKTDVDTTINVLKKLWESAIQVNRNNVDCWVDYIRFVGDVVKDHALVAKLYWAACKETGRKQDLERRLNQQKR